MLADFFRGIHALLTNNNNNNSTAQTLVSSYYNAWWNNGGSQHGGNSVKSVRAIPMLVQPFPVPDILTVTILPATTTEAAVVSEELGVQIIYPEVPRDIDRVRILRVSKASPLYHTRIRKGQTILAVNGTPVTCPSHIMSCLSLQEPGSSLTLTTTRSVLPPFCRLVLHPDLTHNNAQFHLSATRRNSLVAWGTTQQQQHNTILLAVNGRAVSNPSMAYELLHRASDQFESASQQQWTAVLYLVDLWALRDSIVQELRNNHKDLTRVELVQQDEQTSLDDSAVFRLEIMGSNSNNRNATTTYKIDSVSQHLVPTKKDHLHDVEKDETAATAIRQRFVQLFNKGMEDRLLLLEEAVCMEVWKQQGEECGDEDDDAVLAPFAPRLLGAEQTQEASLPLAFLAEPEGLDL